MKTVEYGNAEWHKLNVLQEAIKLVLNSCYGKLAQRRPTTGKYTNLHWASHITGATRAKVRARTWRREAKGSIVIYQHTDSVLTIGNKPPASEVGKELGEWGLEDEKTEDAFLIQPGLMMGLKGGKSATRGVGKTEFSRQALQFSATQDFSKPPSEWGKLVVPIRRMTSRKLAHARHKPNTAGLFKDDTLTVQVSPHKRNLANAVQIPGRPELWFLPPVEFIESATLEDVLSIQKESVDDGLSEMDTVKPWDEEWKTIW